MNKVVSMKKIENSVLIFYFLIMRGLISINFIDNGKIRNEYPVVIYYNGDEDALLPTIVNDEELSQYIYRNFITLKSYSKTNIYAVTYFSDDDDEDSTETVSKHTWRIEDINMLSINSDAKIKLLNDILTEITNDNGECKNLIKNLLQHKICATTIMNYVRYKAQTYQFAKDNIRELVKTAEEMIKTIKNEKL